MELVNGVSTSPDFQEKKKMNRKSIFLGILGLLIAVGLFALVWFVVLQKKNLTLLSPTSDNGFGAGTFAEKVINPLTGVVYKGSEVTSWEGTRPLSVMINNHLDARPQSGIAEADLVYEIVAEGGITRYLAFFLTSAPEKLGPIRSAREYYLVLVKELGDAMFMHHGWSPQARTAIDSWPVRSLQVGNAPYWRDNPNNVASEHTLYANGVELRERGDELGWQGDQEFTTWKFKDDSPVSTDAGDGSTPTSNLLEIDFWYEGDYTGIFEYDSSTNSYLRYTGYDADGNPIPTIDRETKEQVSAKNVVIQFVTESPIVGDDKSRLEYQLIGSGQGLVFLDGTIVEVTWAKEGRDKRTIFYDMDGNEAEFNRGKVWIAIVPDRNIDQVTY